MRYSIVVREHGSDRDIELLQVDSRPEAIVAGLKAKTLNIRLGPVGGKRLTKIPKYWDVRIVDRGG